MCIHTITCRDQIDTPWVEMESARIGCIAAELGTPDKYILLDQESQPVLRVDAYGNSDESYAFSDALVWNGFLIIGWGHKVYLLRIKSRSIVEHPLFSYFGHLYAYDDYLLITSGERVFRIGPDGELVWQSEVLGIDGVVVHDVQDGITTGNGEWDPPGGWRPFRIRLDSGQSETAK